MSLDCCCRGNSAYLQMSVGAYIYIYTERDGGREKGPGLGWLTPCGHAFLSGQKNNIFSRLPEEDRGPVMRGI
eukprot:1893169-Pyramimonas_sp.AAC.1